MAIIGYSTIRDPLFELDRIRSEMDRMLGVEPRPHGTASRLPLRITEDAESVLVEAEVPGIDPATIELTATGDTLTIRGERPDLREDGEREHVRERVLGPFHRSITVPGGFDPEGIGATYERGMLSVRLPHRKETRPRTIEVRAG